MDRDLARGLGIIRDGLPRTARPLKVVVVGGGMSGLTAALELRRAGHDVHVLEAQARLGGRVQTLREPFAPGLSAEAGAMRIPDGHALTFAYIRKFGLETAPFVQFNPRGWCFLGGRRERIADARARPDLLGWDLAPAERRLGPDRMLERAVAPLVRRIKAGGERAWRAIERKYDELSVRDFLKAEGWSENALELFGLLNNYESLMSTSFVEMLRDDLLLQAAGAVSYIVGGMDRLPAAFAPALGDRIRFGARVTAIEQKTESVVVHFRTEGGSFAETADALVLSTPFPALRHIAVSPPFSIGKRRAIRSLHYDASTKIFLQFRRRFWAEDDGITGGKSITDLAVRNVHYPSDAGTGRGVLLASYTWGGDSQRWSSLPPRERIARALDDVAALHGPSVRALFEAGASKSWHDDEFAGGAFALFQPGQQTVLQHDIARPEGRIHFAGEHTTLKHAWIEGAVESGLRAAEEVHALASAPA